MTIVSAGGSDLKLSKGVGVVGQAEGVKVVATGVHLVQAIACWAAIHPVALNQAHEHHLHINKPLETHGPPLKHLIALILSHLRSVNSQLL